MLSTNTNILIAVLLVIANAIPIYMYSYRKKKLGIYSLSIFVILFCTYLIYYTFPFKNTIDEKEHLYEMERNASDRNEETRMYSSGIDKEEQKIASHLENMDIMLRISTMQSLICLGLSIIGLSTVSGRNRYYLILLFVHFFFFCFCCILEATEHFTNN